jgi:hypothetical protein
LRAGLPPFAVQLEALETRLANGEPIDVAEYTQLTSTLVRVVSSLGVERTQRDVTPSLAQYLASFKAEAPRGGGAGHACRGGGR